jgi:hypothetical protein
LYLGYAVGREMNEYGAEEPVPAPGEDNLEDMLGGRASAEDGIPVGVPNLGWRPGPPAKDPKDQLFIIEDEGPNRGGSLV